MFTRLREFMFACVMLVALAVPQVSSAAICWSAAAGGGGWSLSFGSSCASMVTPYGLPGGSILGIVSSLVNWLLALFGILGILGFVISGIMYLVSAGDSDMAKRAKSGMVYSIIGIIVGLSGFVIMMAINGLLSGMPGNY